MEEVDEIRSVVEEVPLLFVFSSGYVGRVSERGHMFPLKFITQLADPLET